MTERRTAYQKKVFEQSNGICAICGVDTKIEAKLLRELQDSWIEAKQARLQMDDRYRRTAPSEKALTIYRLLVLRVEVDAHYYPHLYTWAPKGTGAKKRDPKQLGFQRLIRQHAYEIDHIVPYSQKPETTIEGLRLLCIKCHQHVTKTLTNKRAYLNGKIRSLEKKLQRANKKEQYRKWKRLREAYK